MLMLRQVPVLPRATKALELVLRLENLEDTQKCMDDYDDMIFT